MKKQFLRRYSPSLLLVPLVGVSFWGSSTFGEPKEGRGENPSPPRSVRRLRLEEAIQMALENNPSLLATVEGIHRAEARLGQSQAQSSPQLSFISLHTQQGPIRTITFPPTTPGQPPRTIKLGQSLNRVWTFSLTQPLDVSGRLRLTRILSGIALNQAKTTVEQARNDLILKVYEAYLNLLRAKAFSQVQEQAVSAAREHHRIALAQYQAGTAAQFDVLRASVQVENLRQTLVSAQRVERSAQAGLAILLGLDPSEPIEVEPAPQLPPPPSPVAPPLIPASQTGGGNQDKAKAPQPSSLPTLGTSSANPSTENQPQPPPEGETLDRIPNSLEEALEEAYRNRPEVRLAEESIRLAQRQKQLEYRGRLPLFNITGNYTFTPDAQGFAPVKKSWNITANLTWNLWDSGLVKERIREAEANLRAAEDQAKQARLTVALDVRNAFLELEEARERRRTASANVLQAEEALRIARLRFQNGISTGVEVTDAEVALTQAQVNAVNADYDYLIALARLYRALGRFGKNYSAKREK